MAAIFSRADGTSLPCSAHHVLKRGISEGQLVNHREASCVHGCAILKNGNCNRGKGITLKGIYGLPSEESIVRFLGRGLNPIYDKLRFFVRPFEGSGQNPAPSLL